MYNVVWDFHHQYHLTVQIKHFKITTCNKEKTTLKAITEAENLKESIGNDYDKNAASTKKLF